MSDSSDNNSITKNVFVVILVLHEFSVLHAEQCAAVSRNVVKRLTNQNRVKCLFDLIDQSNM